MTYRASTIFSLTLMVFLTACSTATPPQPQPEPPAAAIDATSTPEETIVADVQPADSTVIPQELVCPEPEPVEPAVCPPVVAPKCPVCPAAKLDDKLLVGEIEKVTVEPPGIVYTARIDSGAAGTSLHATDIVRFERDGERWVRFTLENPSGEPVTLERRVIRRVRIKQVELEDFERRLVVMMTLSLGSITEQSEVSLTDRSQMEYPVLIGRNFLRNNAIVDVSQELIAK